MTLNVMRLASIKCANNAEERGIIVAKKINQKKVTENVM